MDLSLITATTRGAGREAGADTAIYERDVSGESRLYKVCMTCAPGLTSEVEVTSGYDDTRPRWNRTGTYAVLERKLDNTQFVRAIYVVKNQAGSFNVQRVADWKGLPGDKNDDSRPVWFDDDPNVPASDALDSMIVFERRSGDPPQGEDYDLYSVSWAPDVQDAPTSSTAPVEILSEAGVDHTYPQISWADPDKILYVHDDTAPELHRYAIDSADDTLVVNSPVSHAILNERASNFVVQRYVNGAFELYIIDD